MAEIKFEPFHVTFSRIREIEEVCRVEINLPNYYSQGTKERAALEHANAHGIWKETREMNLTGVAVVKGELRHSVCKHCGLSELCRCDE